MENNITYRNKNELNVLCDIVRKLIKEMKYCECETIIADAMKKYPHAPEPHNLMGIKFEREGEHLMAMKHFRASSALDPTYLPARFNMEQYGEMFCICRNDAFDERDCPQEIKKKLYKIEYDENGIGHLVERK